MQVVKHINDLQPILNDQRKLGLSIGFIPTMGALHNGHLSLVEMAGRQTGFVVVSIFVNPTQFNDKSDLARYPRDLQKDISLLEGSSCNLVFAPDTEEIYPEPDTRQFNFGELEQVMEGKFRPGHFNGVAQVVCKLFDIIQPEKAFFGQKDFQQLAIINELVRNLELSVEIVSCPIIREPDGLAMSSRNSLLNPDERQNAVHISATLIEAVNKTVELSVEELCLWVVNRINQNKYLHVEYFQVVNEKSLLPVINWSDQGKKVGCIAVHCGKIRLIDNIEF